MPGLPPEMAALLTPAAYPHPVRGLRLVETHISWVLLTGDYAYKIKKPVRYPFVDLSSAPTRAFLCREELRLNRRFAPALYLDVVDVTCANGRWAIDGGGKVREKAVRMRQFPPDEELDRLLASGGIVPAELEAFGDSLAAIHARLPAASARQGPGSTESLRGILRDNVEECIAAAESLDTAPRVAALAEGYRRRIDDAREAMDARLRAGRVRECHGDLHAGNVVRYGGHLLAFDCLEFDPKFRWIDVADEIAFLVMDLESAGCPEHARAFRAGWLAASGDFEACRLLRLYEVHRALVRAKVAALRAAGTLPGAGQRDARSEHRRYLDHAEGAMTLRRPSLLLMHGLSGAGKTWLAERLAPALDAIHLRSDVERKRLAGLDATARSGSPPGAGLYAPELGERTYARLLECAEQALAGGYDVIVDATFRQRGQRQPFAALAARAGVPAAVLDCRAPRHVLEERIRARARTGDDASEADLAVLAWQEARREPVAEDETLPVIAVDTTRPDPAGDAKAHIAELSRS